MAGRLHEHGVFLSYVFPQTASFLVWRGNDWMDISVCCGCLSSCEQLPDAVLETLADPSPVPVPSVIPGLSAQPTGSRSDPGAFHDSR